MPEIGLGIFRPLYFSPDLLWRWKAGWAGGTFTRASAAWYVGPDGRIYQAATNVPRIEWYDLDGDGVRETPTVLLESARTNALTWSEDLSQSAWAKTNCTIAADVATAPTGTGTADKIVESTTPSVAHFISRSVNPITPGSPQAFSAFVRAAERSRAELYFINVDRFGVAFDLAAGTIADIREGAATLLRRRIERLADEWYRVEIAGIVNSTAASGTLVLRLLDGTGSPTYTGDGTSGLYAWGVQAEVDRAAWSSYVQTGAATATRAGDSLTFDWLHAPGPYTGYLRFVEQGAVLSPTTTVLLQLGTLSVRPFLRIEQLGGASRYRIQYERAVGSTATSTLPAAPVPGIGDVVEILWRLYADGSVQIEQSINGGTPTVAARSSAIGLPPAWSGQVLGLSISPGAASQGQAAWRDAVVLRGSDWTWDELRSIVGT